MYISFIFHIFQGVIQAKMDVGTPILDTQFLRTNSRQLKQQLSIEVLITVKQLTNRQTAFLQNGVPYKANTVW